MTRSFLRDDDLTPAEQAEVLELALRMKAEPFAYRPFEGPQSVATVYDRPTLRTQVSFAAGIAELGGHPMNVDGGLAAMGQRESVEDVSRVLGRQAVAIVWRTAHQSDMETMAAYAGVPIVNALTDEFHPCQLLADLLTVREHKGRTAGLRVAFVGAPEGHGPDETVVKQARAIGAETGGEVTVLADPVEAVTGADVVVTDTWVSMGREEEAASRLALFTPYAVTPELLTHAKADAIVMHCLPAYRGKEIAAEVIDGPHSVVWDEAENRRHAQKAILTYLMERR